MNAFEIKPYTHYRQEEILPLYESVGWSNYTRNPEMLRRAFEHSLKIYTAYQNGQLAGLIRAVGDGFSVVFVQDLLVHPACQRQGIGTALLKTLLQEYKDVYQFHLLTDNTEKTVRFYKSLGFTADTEMNCCAFSRYCTK